MNEKNAENRDRARQQWEYQQICEWKLDTGIWKVGDYLAHLGKEGWEAYGVVQTPEGFIHFFKRPIIIEPPPGQG
ncbi:hypothetical protein WMF04_25770 [Sorangium sp. So ce260]|uniref:hypothetical protein n=1 Tax=Sorangium sp. So ce260 TaxID=3133291 RepID=UPI003F62B83D